MRDATLETLKQLGWGDYEAKAYVALLQGYPATGYRVAKASGVPSAKVYEALARLAERGAVRITPASEGEPTQYVPVPPEEVTAGLRARHLRMLDDLSRDLTTLLAPGGETSEFDRLRGRAPVLGRAGAILASARKSVALVVPTGWEAALKGELDAAKSRAVRVDRIVVAPEASSEPGLFVLVADGAEALIGSLGSPTDDRAAEALATKAPFLVRLAADYALLRRALALVPDAVARLQRRDDWLDWEEAKQRRLLQVTAPRPESSPGAPH